jgi:hypothetical protein
MGQPLGDGGLAHAGLTDQHRVVLGPPTEHLHRAADLVVAPDHGIEFALARDLGQVPGVALERLVLILGILVGYVAATAHVAQRGKDAVGGSPEAPEHFAGLVGAAGHGEQHVLGRQVVVLEFLDGSLGLPQHLFELSRNAHVDGALDAADGVQSFLRSRRDGPRIGTQFL